MTKRIVEKYLGFELVAAYWKGEFQGRAWGEKDGGIHVKGSSLEDVISKLKDAVDIDSPELAAQFKRDIIEKQVQLKRTLIEKHGEFLRRKGIDPDSFSAHEVSSVYDRSHRTPRCYACKSNLDNEIDLECSRCSWIICNNCGACGCGHPQYKQNFSNTLASSQHVMLIAPTFEGKSDSQSFQEFATATEYARLHPGAILNRHPSGEGWVVTYKSSFKNGS